MNELRSEIYKLTITNLDMANEDVEEYIYNL